MGGRGEGLNLQKKPVAILNVNRKKVVCTIQIPRLIKESECMNSSLNDNARGLCYTLENIFFIMKKVFGNFKQKP